MLFFSSGGASRQTGSKSDHPGLVPLLFLVTAGLAISLASYFYLSVTESQNIRTDIQMRARERSELLESTVQRSTEALNAVTSLLQSQDDISRPISREKFLRFVSGARSTFGVDGTGVVAPRFEKSTQSI